MQQEGMVQVGYARSTTYSKEVEMLRDYYQKFRAFLMRIWHALRKDTPVAITLNGKPLDASDPRAQRLLRRLRQRRARRTKVQ
jgi:hypothetical protein